MLLGQFGGRIDEKNRVGFPKSFRIALGDKLIVTLGFERSLIIVSEKNYKALLEGTEGKPLTSKAARDVKRYLLGGASSVELDGKGRFIIPDYLLLHAMLKKDVVFLGVERYVEVWDKSCWEAEVKILEKNIVSVADRLTQDEK